MIIQIILLFVQIVCVVLSGGRGGFLLLCVYGMVFAFSFAKLTRRNALMLIALSYITMLSFAFFLSNSMELSSFTNTRGFERIFTFHNNRSEVFKPALGLIAKHPYIGYGVGGYFSELGVYPHNIVLEVLLNWGVIGLSLAAVITTFVIKNLSRLFRVYNGFAPLAFIAVSPVVLLMVSSSFMANATLWFFIGLSFSPLSLGLGRGGCTVPAKRAFSLACRNSVY